jgi:4-methylaminobutanoate oxidase (formaldehyde-forming)
VSFRDVTSAYAVINVIGPRSRELLQRNTPEDVGPSAFPFGTLKILTVGCARVMSFRVTYVGELGFELYIPMDNACHVYETLWDSGRDLGIANAGYRAVASMHLEKGFPDWGSELTPEYTPYDAGLGFCVALEKETFLGKSSLARIKTTGPRWTLCTFTIDAGSPLMLQSSAPILHNGRVVGVTTSSGYGHTIGRNICYGYLPADMADVMEKFEVESYRRIYPARREPNRRLYDPERRKILS